MRCVLITFLGSVVLTAVSPKELPSQVLPLKTPNSQTNTENVKEIRIQKKWRTEDPEIEMNAVRSHGFIYFLKCVFCVCMSILDAIRSSALFLYLAVLGEMEVSHTKKK